MEVGFCSKCNHLDAFTGDTVCPECGGKFLDLGVDVDEWNLMDNTQMRDCIVAAIKNDQQSGEAESADNEGVPAEAAGSENVVSENTVPESEEPENAEPEPEIPEPVKAEPPVPGPVKPQNADPGTAKPEITVTGRDALKPENTDAGHTDHDHTDSGDTKKDRELSLRERVKMARSLLLQYYELDDETAIKKEELKSYKVAGYMPYVFLISGAVAVILGIILIIVMSLISVILGVLSIALGGLLIWLFILRRKGDKGANAQKIAESEQEVEKLIKRTDDSYRQITETLPELPEEYYDEETLERLDRIFTSNKADNMPQALSMIDERERRRKTDAGI